MVCGIHKLFVYYLLQDPQDLLKEDCGEAGNCAKYRAELDVCNDRVNSKTSTTETCTQELFDFIHCVDSCVSNKSTSMQSFWEVVHLALCLDTIILF